MDDGVLSIPGSKQDLQCRNDLDGPLGELPAAYRPGHHNIGEQKIGLHALFQDCKSLSAALCHKNGVAEIFQHRCYRGPHNLVVVVDKDGLGARHGERSDRHWLDDLLAKTSRQVELDCRPFADLAVNF